jgi:serine/threonine protein kinase
MIFLFLKLHKVKHIHEKNIIHHDLKLQNIIYDAGLIKIIDFGLSKQITCVDESHYQFGTYWYLPPECFLNEKSTLKIDIWSIGIDKKNFQFKINEKK